MAIRKVPVIVFVDWNAQIHAVRVGRELDPPVDRILRHVTKAIESVLTNFIKDHRFQVTLRLYHGWHKGYEPTARRRDLAAVDQAAMNLSNSCRSIVYFDPQFGDRALGALKRRIIKQTGSHFAGTVREQGAGKVKEAMVDGALIADLVFAASNRDEDSWLVVLGQDIDLAPGVLTAEGLLETSGRKVAFAGVDVVREKYIDLSRLQTH